MAGAVPASVHVDAVQDGHRAWKGIFKEHVEATKRRAITSAVIITVAAILISALVRARLWPLLILAGVAGVALLAHHGHPKDKPILHPATVTPRFRKLTADIVLRAYYAAKLGDPEKEGQQVTFGSTMARDGEGTRVLVDLPYGRTLKNAADAPPKPSRGPSTFCDVQTMT